MIIIISLVIMSPCIIIDYIPYTVHFISRTWLFCSWKFLLLNVYLFLSLPFPQLPVCSLYL